MDMSPMSDVEKLALLEMLEAKILQHEQGALFRYVAYEKQRKFHAAGRDPDIRERLLIAANQCLCPHTLVETPAGERAFGDLILDGSGEILTWADGQRRTAPWRRPMLMGVEPACRVVLDNGKAFDCSREHEVWTPDGWLSAAQLMQRAEYLRWLAVAQDSPDTGLCWSDSAAVARVRSWPIGGPQTLTEGEHALLKDLFARFASPLLTPAENSQAERLFPGEMVPPEVAVHLRLYEGLECSRTLEGLGAWPLGLFPAHRGPELLGGVRVLAILPIGYQPIIDVQVPNQHSYLAAGVLHHNCGKTYSSCAEIAMHLTGEYPDGWPGAEWGQDVVGWAGSVTAQATRDTLQRLLMGRPGSWGTGLIPGDRITDIKRAAGNVPDCIESVSVKHKGGGTSRLVFKNYAQGREAWQGETLDFVAFDEEPPLSIYMEGLTRTNATNGIVWLTFTPLLGMTAVVKRFLKEKAPGTYVVHMTIDDAGHYTPADRLRIAAAYPEHERDARARGIPVMGSGMIYPVPEADIRVQGFSVPAYWPRICGLDFGYDHPTAAVWLAWDRDADVVYVTDAYRKRQATPVIHAAAIKARGDWIPIAWPHDGVAHDKGGGEPLRNQYQEQGCNMLPEKATHAPSDGMAEGTGGYSVEAGVLSILDRMQTGRLKVFANLSDWWEEFRLYHRQEGIIVKEDDDVMDAMRAAIMMLRHAKIRPRPKHHFHTGFRPLNASVGY